MRNDGSDIIAPALRKLPAPRCGLGPLDVRPLGHIFDPLRKGARVVKREVPTDTRFNQLAPWCLITDKKWQSSLHCLVDYVAKILPPSWQEE